MNKICCYLLVLVILIFCVFLIDYLKLKHSIKIETTSDTTEMADEKSYSEIDEQDRDIKELLLEYLNDIEDYSLQKQIKKKNRFLPFAFPLNYQKIISQSFSENHPGTDLVAPVGTKTIATAAGKVEKAQFDKYFGNLIIIDHFNGYFTYYAHLDELFVEYGDFAEKGDVIGTVGTSGYSTGPHLHYSIQKEDRFIDPEGVWNLLTHEK